MAEAFGEKKVAEKFKTVSLSNQTVATRVANFGQHVSCKLKIHISKCSYFSLALDESIDVIDISQLIIFAVLADENFDFHEELLAIHPLTCGTIGSDMCKALNYVVSKFEGFEKCSCIVTDGAMAMVESQNGLVGLLRKTKLTALL